MTRATLSATQRIKKSNEITTLIRKGRAFFLSPYKVYYTISASKIPLVRVALSVPKKKFGKAVVRNKLKRLGRESFRLQKKEIQELAIDKGIQIDILLMYQRTAINSYEQVHTAVGEILNKIVKENG